MATFLFRFTLRKEKEELEEGLEAVDARLGGVSLFAGGVGAEGFLGGSGSGAEGFTPFIVSIPSTVTVFPSGSFSTFPSFLLPMRGRLEQEVKTRRKAAERIITLAMDLLF
jgi:hypothetical protein